MVITAALLVLVPAITRWGVQWFDLLAALLAPMVAVYVVDRWLHRPR